MDGDRRQQPTRSAYQRSSVATRLLVRMTVLLGSRAERSLEVDFLLRCDVMGPFTSWRSNSLN